MGNLTKTHLALLLQELVTTTALTEAWIPKKVMRSRRMHGKFGSNIASICFRNLTRTIPLTEGYYLNEKAQQIHPASVQRY
jgi:hypothetical protein